MPDRLPVGQHPSTAPTVTLIGVGGLPEVRPGNDLADLLVQAAQGQGTPLETGDVLVVTQKVVSKAEGRLVQLKEVEPSPFALEVARLWGRDPRHIEVILRETRRIVRMERGVLITETHHGFRCANAGVDTSNVAGHDVVALLPRDPDASARALQDGVQARTGATVAVIISDTFGRPWREGAANVAIGVAGLLPLRDYRGRQDAHGHDLHTTVIAVADELAAAAELVTNKLTRVPAAIVRGYAYDEGEGQAGQLLRPSHSDLFR